MPSADADRITHSDISARAGGVRVRDVSKSFVVQHQKGSFQLIQALAGLNIDIAEGEFVSLLGPSGCGKTTTLRLLAGLDSPDQGLVEVCGEELTQPGLNTSLVFQNFNLLPWRTVIKNIALGLELGGVRDASNLERVKTYLDLVGLSEFANHYPHQLSGGMQQRVGLARALVMRSPVLLMDEPFGALDALTREILQRELLIILDQTEPRRTIVFVTHDVEEAIYLSDRVLIFEGPPGRITRDVAVGLPKPRYEVDVKTMIEFADIRSEILDVMGVGA